jgi:hypothetical protein
MINEEQRQWLTAFADGEATPKERRAVADLLRKSPEARRFLHALQQDAEQLKALRPMKLPESFSQRVLDQIRMRGLQRPVTILIIPVRRRMAWVRRLAVAAAVFVAVGAATYFFVMHNAALNPGQPLASSQPGRSLQQPDKPDIAALEPKNDARNTVAPKDDVRSSALTAADVEQFGRAVANWAEPIKRSLLDSVDSLGSAGTAIAANKPSPDEVLTNRMIGTTRLKSVTPHLPPLEDFRSLEDARIVDPIKEGGFQLVDISCQESWKGLDRFEAACRANGFKIIVDGDAALRRTKKLPAMYVIYIENIAPEKVAKILQAAEGEDKKAEAKIKNDVQFNSVLVLPLEETWRKWVAEMLGVAPASFVHPRAASKSPTSIDTTKPLQLDTQKSLEKLGSSPSAGKATAKEPTALIMVIGPAKPAMQMSKEIKQFLEVSSGLQPDVVHAVFVLRPSKG